MFIPDPDPDFLPIQGSKTNRITDPDPQHWFLCRILFDLDDALPDEDAVVGLDLELGGADAVADGVRGHLQLQQPDPLH